jgi:hypothetical protein
MRPSCRAAAPKHSAHGVWGADRHRVPNSDMTYENRISEDTASRFHLSANPLPTACSSGVLHAQLCTKRSRKWGSGIGDREAGSRKREAGSGKQEAGSGEQEARAYAAKRLRRAVDELTRYRRFRKQEARRVDIDIELLLVRNPRTAGLELNDNHRPVRADDQAIDGAA